MSDTISWKSVRDQVSWKSVRDQGFRAIEHLTVDLLSAQHPVDALVALEAVCHNLRWVAAELGCEDLAQMLSDASTEASRQRKGR